MPKTNTSEQTQNSHPENPTHQKSSNDIDCAQQLFMMDFVARSTTFSQATNICLNILETNEAYRSNPNRSDADAHRLAVSVDECETLKTFFLEAIELFSESIKARPRTDQ